MKVLVVMALAAACAAVGQILVKKGMDMVGPLTHYAPLELARYFWTALTNPYVVGGTVLNAGFYFLFMAALSWANVTVALPMSALEFGFAAVLAIAFLGENVPPVRWAGIALVILGVALITLSQPAGQPS